MSRHILNKLSRPVLKHTKSLFSGPHTDKQTKHYTMKSQIKTVYSIFITVKFHIYNGQSSTT